LKCRQKGIELQGGNGNIERGKDKLNLKIHASENRIMYFYIEKIKVFDSNVSEILRKNIIPITR
jgi:hypothetical protein